jgi:hypothetical protein
MCSMAPLLVIVFGGVCIFGYILYHASGGDWDAESPAPDPVAEPRREPWEERAW